MASSSTNTNNEGQYNNHYNNSNKPSLAFPSADSGSGLRRRGVNDVGGGEEKKNVDHDNSGEPGRNGGGNYDDDEQKEVEDYDNDEGSEAQEEEERGHEKDDELEWNKRDSIQPLPPPPLPLSPPQQQQITAATVATHNSLLGSGSHNNLLRRISTHTIQIDEVTGLITKKGKQINNNDNNGNNDKDLPYLYSPPKLTEEEREQQRENAQNACDRLYTKALSQAAKLQSSITAASNLKSPLFNN